jgi:hypothetical protein
LLLALALGACAATTGGAGPNLSEREASHDRLIVVHYPSNFFAFFEGEHIHLAGPRGASQLSDMYFNAQGRPASEDLNALGRTEAFCAEDLSVSVIERSHRPASCFGGLPGLERSCAYAHKATPHHSLVSWECMFVKNHHLFRFGYTMPTAVRAEVEPLLRKVLAATEAN